MASSYGFSPASVYNRYLGTSGFKGVDFSSAPAFVSPDRFSDAKNVYKDYKSGLGASIETFPGYRCPLVFTEGGLDVSIYTMATWKVNKDGNVLKRGDYVAIHVDRHIIIVEADAMTRLASSERLTINLDDFFPAVQALQIGGETFYCVIDQFDLNSVFGWDDTTMFTENGDLYVFSSDGYFRIDSNLLRAERIADGFWFDEGTTVRTTYIPTAFINGEKYEQMNIMRNGYAELFTQIDADVSEDTGGNRTILFTFNPGGFTQISVDENGEYKSNFNIYVDDKLVWNADRSPFYKPKDDGTGYSVTLKYRGTQIIEPQEWQGSWENNVKPFDEIVIKHHILSDDVGKVSELAPESIVRFEVVGVKQGSNFDFSAIENCTVVAKHDGRVFFMGNPDYPNIAFYSQRRAADGLNDPSYIGVNNYFQIGGEGSMIKATVSTASDLIVLKEASKSGAESTIYFVSGTATGDDLLTMIYSANPGAVGVGCSAAAANFVDDIVFSSEQGIFGINKLQTNLERSVTCRSNMINGRFLTEDPAVKMTVWDGYLCVLCKSGHMYLADSRQLSSDGYEWYFIDSIGAYIDDETDYAVVSDMEGNVYGENREPVGEIVPSADGYAVSEIKMGKLHTGAGDLNVLYRDLIDSDPKKVIVLDASGEKIGGRFEAASEMLTVGESIWFGTKSGHLLVLNTDLRGLPNGEDDAGIDSQRIRGKWYTHMGHRYDSYVVTYYDDAGVPNQAKTTINRSTVIDMKTIPGSAFKVSVYTEREGWETPAKSAAGILDYGETDFSNSSYANDIHTVVTLREHTHRWSRKMYRVYSDEFCRPFGIYRISYQYKIAGRIKD